MLAHPTKSLTEVLDRFEEVPFTCEYKYDGERAKVHLLEDGKFMIYSRNSENMSAKYPDIIETMPKVTFSLPNLTFLPHDGPGKHRLYTFFWVLRMRG